MMSDKDRAPNRMHLVCWTMVALLTAPAALAGGQKAAKDVLNRTRALMVGKRPIIKPGQWVSYRFQMPLGPEHGHVESLLKISSPLHADVDHPLEPGQAWLEFEMADPDGESDAAFAIKMLVGGDPRNPDSIKRVLVKGGQRMAMELDRHWLQDEQKKDSEQNNAKACERLDEKGCAAAGGKVRKYKPKKLYTKLGWLMARRVVVKIPQARAVREYWLSDKVPFFQIVKASLGNGIELQLEGFGQGALSRIDETRAAPLPDPEELKRQILKQPD